jgi:hypothetical protein
MFYNAATFAFTPSSASTPLQSFYYSFSTGVSTFFTKEEIARGGLIQLTLGLGSKKRQSGCGCIMMNPVTLTSAAFFSLLSGYDLLQSCR